MNGCLDMAPRCGIKREEKSAFILKEINLITSTIIEDRNYFHQNLGTMNK